MSGIDVDLDLGVRAIGRRHLEPAGTVRTGDEDGLPMLEVMEALEDVEATQRDPLPGATVATGEDDFREELAEQVQSQGPRASAGLSGFSGWRASRKRASMCL